MQILCLNEYDNVDYDDLRFNFVNSAVCIPSGVFCLKKHDVKKHDVKKHDPIVSQDLLHGCGQSWSWWWQWRGVKDNHDVADNDNEEEKTIQPYAKIYAKGVVSAVATDHHDKDGQCLNQ